jgi:hypothetical protein
VLTLSPGPPAGRGARTALVGRGPGRQAARVGAALQRIKGEGLRMVETKTARGRRVVTLPDVCVAALRAHKVRQIQGRLVAGSRWVARLV